MMIRHDKTRAMLAVLSFICSGSGLFVSAGVQVTVDATKQISGPPRGRGPFRGSYSAGHSAGLPIRLELLIPSGELSREGTVLVDFLITNIGSDPIRLPSSIRQPSRMDRPYSLLSLWLTGDAVVRLYAVDKQTGRLFEIKSVMTSAELYDDSDNPGSSALLRPGASMLVHAASQVQLSPGSHSMRAHAELLQFPGGSAALGETADSEPVRKTLTKFKFKP